MTLPCAAINEILEVIEGLNISLRVIHQPFGTKHYSTHVSVLPDDSISPKRQILFAKISVFVQDNKECYHIGGFLQ